MSRKNIEIGKEWDCILLVPWELYETDFKIKELICLMGRDSRQQACTIFHDHSSLLSSSYGIR